MEDAFDEDSFDEGIFDGYDADEVEELIPAGDYLITVESIKRKPTKDRKGAYIQVELTVAEGDYSGRSVFHIFNIRNNNPKAQHIGQRMFKKFHLSLGIENPSTSDEFVGKSCMCRIGIQEANGNYDESNKVNKFWGQDEESPGKQEKLPF